MVELRVALATFSQNPLSFLCRPAGSRGAGVLARVAVIADRSVLNPPSPPPAPGSADQNGVGDVYVGRGRDVGFTNSDLSARRDAWPICAN